MWQHCQLSPNFIVKGRDSAGFFSTPWCLLYHDAKYDMKRASRFKRTEGLGSQRGCMVLVPLALLQAFPIFPPRVLPSEVRGGSTGLCAASTAPAVHAHGPGAPQLPHPCLGCLGARSLEMSLPRANRPWVLHLHQVLPSTSGCCTPVRGCPAMQIPPLLEATTPVCVLDACVLTHRVLLSRSISLFPLPWPVAGTRL